MYSSEEQIEIIAVLFFNSATVMHVCAPTHTDISDPAAPRLSGGLVNSSVCVCVFSTHLLNKEATQRRGKSSR